jgi:hypothetical protein
VTLAGAEVYRNFRETTYGTGWRNGGISMKVNSRIVLALVSGAALGVAVVTGLMAQVKAPIYAVIDISEMILNP